MQNNDPHFPLLENATEASRIRYQVAYELAQLCLPLLGKECVLTGSSSRGLADEASDIEQVFYVDKLPSLQERERWLNEVGVADLHSETEPIADGSIWATFRFHDIWIEAGWQTIEAHEKNLQYILAGNVIDHHHLKLAEIITHALPLRSQGLLAQWQQKLSHYPDTLPASIIADATELWTFPPIVEARWALIRRGEFLGLFERLVRDVHNCLRMLFALNRQWEPEWKWLRSATSSLTIKPERLVERINEVFTTAQPEMCVLTCLRLISETLLLASPAYDVMRALRTIEASLRSQEKVV